MLKDESFVKGNDLASVLNSLSGRTALFHGISFVYLRKYSLLLSMMYCSDFVQSEICG